MDKANAVNTCLGVLKGRDCIYLDNLMQFIAPGAPETGAGAAQTAAPAQTGGAPNAVEELKQYKSLLDAGVITEEEFAAKKRQQLGI